MPPKPQPRRQRASAKRRQSSNRRLKLPRHPLTQPAVREAAARSRCRARSLLSRARRPHRSRSSRNRRHWFLCSLLRPVCLLRCHLCSRRRWLRGLLCQHRRHSRNPSCQNRRHSRNPFQAGCQALQAVLRVWPCNRCRRHNAQRLRGLVLWARFQPGCSLGALHPLLLPTRLSLQLPTPHCWRLQTQLCGMKMCRCRPLLRQRQRLQMRRTLRCWQLR